MRFFSFLRTTFLMFSTLWAFHSQLGLADPATGTQANSGENSFYQLKATTLGKKVLSFETYANKVVLVVNIASKCGFTSQLEGLQKLHDRFAAQGFEVVAFPSNDFKQEDLEGLKIGDFCKMNYGVKYTIFEKSHVNGAERHPVYQYLIKNSETPKDDVGWNFEKFLVDSKGKVIGRYSSWVKPDSDKLIKKIEQALTEVKAAESTPSRAVPIEAVSGKTSAKAEPNGKSNTSAVKTTK